MPGRSLGAGALSPSPEEMREKIQTEAKRIADQLGLTEDQKAKVQPVLKETFEKRRAVLEKYKGQHDRKTLRIVRKEMDVIDKETDAKLKPMVTAEQLEDFKKMRAEMRQQWRDQVKARKMPKSEPQSQPPSE